MKSLICAKKQTVALSVLLALFLISPTTAQSISEALLNNNLDLSNLSSSEVKSKQSSNKKLKNPKQRKRDLQLKEQNKSTPYDINLEEEIDETKPPLSRIEILFNEYDAIDLISIPEVTTTIENDDEKNEKNSLPAYLKTQEYPLDTNDIYTSDNRQKNTSRSKKRELATGNSLEELKEYEDLAEEEKEKLPIRQFGYSFFEQEEITSFENKTPIRPDYILGQDDTLIINIWGKIETQLTVTIDNKGNIFIPNVGQLTIGNLTLKEAQVEIKRFLEKKYVNVNTSIKMGELKTNRIFVLGQVSAPGAYDVSSLSTLISVLYIAGGPTKDGSLRKIEIRRGGKLFSKIDLYDFLLKGDHSKDIRLQDNDTLFVPPIGKVAMVDGLVKVPGIFEIKNGTTAHDLIYTFASGYLPTSFRQFHRLERIEKGNQRTIINLSKKGKISLKKQLKSTQIKDGDRINVGSISDRGENVLSIEGSVFRPGLYRYSKGLTLKDILKTAGGSKENAYLDRVEVYRFKSETNRKIFFIDASSITGQNYKLQDLDIIKVLTKEEALGLKTVKVFGAIREPGTYKLLDDMRISDIVNLSKLEEFADITRVELFRKSPGKPDAVYPLDLSEILKQPHTGIDIKLKNNDHIFIRYNSEDVKLKRVTLTGEVKYPGVYMARESETIADILERAGGFTKEAFLEGSIFKRKNVKQAQTLGQSRILEEEKKRLIFDQRRIGAVNQDNQFVYQSAIRFLEDKIEDSKGRIIINLAPYNTFENSKENVTLEDGDTIDIPVIPDTVQVVGGVQNPTAIIYAPNKKSGYYIDKAGNYTEFASKKDFYIFKSNGSIVSNSTKVERGDIIYVPETIRVYRNWGKIFLSFLDGIFKTATIVSLLK